VLSGDSETSLNLLRGSVRDSALFDGRSTRLQEREGNCRVTLERAIRRAGGLNVKATNRIDFDDQPIVGEIVCYYCYFYD
jgi:hypothetical protein